VFENADVVERRAGNRDDVGVIAGLQRADLTLPSEQLCAVQQIRLEHGEGLHSVLHHQHEFPRLGSMSERHSQRRPP